MKDNTRELRALRKAVMQMRDRAEYLGDGLTRAIKNGRASRRHFNDMRCAYELAVKKLNKVIAGRDIELQITQHQLAKANAKIAALLLRVA